MSCASLTTWSVARSCKQHNLLKVEKQLQVRLEKTSLSIKDNLKYP